MAVGAGSSENATHGVAEENLVCERAVTVSQQHGNVVAVLVRYDEVEVEVPVQVGHRHGKRAVTHAEEDLVGKGSIAVSQQHRHGVVESIRHDEVEVEVPIQVGRCHGTGLVARGKLRVAEERMRAAGADRLADGGDRYGGQQRGQQDIARLSSHHRVLLGLSSWPPTPWPDRPMAHAQMDCSS